MAYAFGALVAASVVAGLRAYARRHFLSAAEPDQGHHQAAGLSAKPRRMNRCASGAVRVNMAVCRDAYGRVDVYDTFKLRIQADPGRSPAGPRCSTQSPRRSSSSYWSPAIATTARRPWTVTVTSDSDPESAWSSESVAGRGRMVRRLLRLGLSLPPG